MWMPVHRPTRPRNSTTFGYWTTYELRRLKSTAQVVWDCCVEPEIDFGQTDQQDPWFIVCCADTGNVVLHIARIGPQYVCALAYPNIIVRCSGIDEIADILSCRMGTTLMH
jgi:hypothetical protein